MWRHCFCGQREIALFRLDQRCMWDMLAYHYNGFCNDQIFTFWSYSLFPRTCIQTRCAWYQREPSTLYIPVTNTNLDQSQLRILTNYVTTNWTIHCRVTTWNLKASFTKTTFAPYNSLQWCTVRTCKTKCLHYIFILPNRLSSSQYFSHPQATRRFCFSMYYFLAKPHEC